MKKQTERTRDKTTNKSSKGYKALTSWKSEKRMDVHLAEKSSYYIDS